MDADDVDILEKVYFVSMLDDEQTVWRQTFELVEVKGYERRVCRVLEELFDYDDLKGSSTPKPRAILRDQFLYNGNKFVDFIPVILVPNEPNLGDTWGASDLEPLYVPINEICRKYSDFADSLAFEMFPITVFKNIDWSNVASPEIKPGATLEIVSSNPDMDADVFKLESSMSSLESLKYFVGEMLDCLHQFSGVPRITRDKIDNVGNMSGAAMRLMYLGIISKCNRKFKYWVPRLEQMYDMVLKTQAVYEGFNLPDDYELNVEAHTKLPTDEMAEVELLGRKMELLLTSITDAMQQLGIENPEEKLAEILKEQAMVGEILEPDIIGRAIAREAGGAVQEQGPAAMDVGEQARDGQTLDE
jgi:hypothetical protein